MEEKSKILAAYKELAIGSNRLPVSIQLVCDRAEVKRSEFHRLFENLNEVQQSIWQEYFMETVRTIEASDQYLEYFVREKLLAFYYTLLEVLKQDMDFVRLFEDQLGVWNYSPRFMSLFKPVFLAFITELVEEGKAREEIAERYVVGGGYASWHWPQVMFILSTWMRDRSPEQERTDQAIEKSVNFGFDFMGRNLLDSGFEFARFLFTRSQS